MQGVLLLLLLLLLCVRLVMLKLIPSTRQVMTKVLSDPSGSEKKKSEKKGKGGKCLIFPWTPVD